MSYLIGTLKQRLIKLGVKITPENSLYLFLEKKLMTSFNAKIGSYWAKHKEDDGILYFEYSDEAPF